MYLLLRHGPSPKEARFIPETKHMGEPASFKICVQWAYDLFGLTGDPAEQLKGLPFKAKYDIAIDEPAALKEEPCDPSLQYRQTETRERELLALIESSQRDQKWPQHQELEVQKEVEVSV